MCCRWLLCNGAVIRPLNFRGPIFFFEPAGRVPYQCRFVKEFSEENNSGEAGRLRENTGECPGGTEADGIVPPYARWYNLH